MAGKGIDAIVDALWKDQSEANWKTFEKALKGSNIKYYKVFYPKKLKKLNDLQGAYVMLYDSAYEPLFKIPVTMKANGKLQGATIYLDGLLNTNKDYKEWVA